MKSKAPIYVYGFFVTAKTWNSETLHDGQCYIYHVDGVNIREARKALMQDLKTQGAKTPKIGRLSFKERYPDNWVFKA